MPTASWGSTPVAYGEWIMATATFSLEVDADTARAFAAVSAEDRRKLELLLALRLRELTIRPARPLKEVMDEIGRYAQARGLTPEILESQRGELAPDGVPRRQESTLLAGSSRKNVFHHVAVHVRQPVVAAGVAEGQLLVVDAE
jgi:hypothetical protein